VVNIADQTIVNGDTILDGFVIERGHANGNFPHNHGRGILVQAAIVGNRAFGTFCDAPFDLAAGAI